MQRTTAYFTIDNIDNFKWQMLNWANHFNVCCFLDSHHYTDSYQSWDCLLAAGACNIFSPKENIFPQLKNFGSETNDWLFGHIGYDVKNEIEQLTSSNADHINFPDIFLFQPITVIGIQKNKVIVSCINEDPKKIYQSLLSSLPLRANTRKNNFLMRSRISKADYIETIHRIRHHILRGDCYEINFCQEFFSDDVIISPLEIYHSLINISPSPFSCFYKLDDKYVLCASPERYLKKKNNAILSQPIKGTLKRAVNKTSDELFKEALRNSEKDKSENVMVVDLVRNDLSKICKKSSVKVKELFGIYSFPQVHQMISTVSGELKSNITFSEILEATFPMGSMTGAPKKRVMELIEQYECTKRGIFSGSIGYITPQKDFDFNVVIRSIMYNAASKYLSYQAGSAITFKSDPYEEYKECLLKAKAIKKVLMGW